MKTFGQADRMAHKLSVTKIKLFHWSLTDHSTHLWLGDKSQTNLWAVLSACPWSPVPPIFFVKWTIQQYDISFGTTLGTKN